MADPIFVDSPAPPKGGPVFVDAPAPPSTPNDWQKSVTPIDLGNGKASVQRSDGGVWFGPEQGNTGRPGWFDDKGNRLGDAPGQPPPHIGVMSRVGFGLKSGAQNVLDSLVQTGVQRFSDTTGGAVVSPSGVNAVNQDVSHDVGARNAAVNSLGLPAKTGRFISESVPYAGASVLAPEVPGAGLATRAAATGIGAAPIAFATTPGTSEEKAKAAAVSAPSAALGQVVGEKVITPVISKIANAVTGRLAPQYQEILALADKYGVPISFTDAAQTPILKKTGAALNEIPLVGTGGFRVQQQAAAKGAAQKFAQDFKNAAPAGDWTDNLQGALKDKFQTVQAQKNALYGKVADAAGDAQIPLPKVNAALDAAESDLKRSALPNSQVLNTIKTLRQNLNPGQNGTPSDTSFSGLQLTRSQLGDAITGLLKSGQDGEAKVLMGVRSAMNQDMGNFAQNSPGLAGAWKDADAFYKSQYVPLKGKAIQNAMKSANPDEIVNTFVQQGKGDRAANFYSALTPDGQASLRAGLVDRALQNATDGNTGVFSPAKFAGYFDKMDVPTSQIFKGEDKWALDGFTKLMRAVQPAGEMGAGPATGNRTILPGSIAAGVTGAITMPHTTATIGGLTYGMSKLFTTNAGKRLLMAASDVPVGSPAMNKIVQQITTLLGAQEGAKSAIPLKALIPMAAQNDQPNQPLQITDLRPQVQP